MAQNYPKTRCKMFDSVTPSMVAIAAALLLICVDVARAVPTITDLGAIPGAQYSYGLGLSANGAVVTGYSGTNPSFDYHAFRWTEATGTQALPNLPNGMLSSGHAVSGDGQTIVGFLYLPGSGEQRAGLWNSAGVFNLGVLQDHHYSEALGVSADGSVVVGSSRDPVPPIAVRWTIGGGMRSLGLLPGTGPGAWSVARSVTPDGRIVVGTSVAADGYQHAFMWTSAGGMEDLGLGLPGYPDVNPLKISADGTTIVGACLSVTIPIQRVAFRWTRASGMTSIPLPFGFSESFATAVNGDGSVVVGIGFGFGAFLWTPSLGTVRLSAYLRNQGVDMSGWGDLQTAWDITPDGSSITGGDRAYLVRGLRLRPCIADVDNGTGTGSPDGGVTIDDLLYYLDIFELGITRADIDDGSGTGTPDGGVTIDDLLYFLQRFEAGC